MELIHWPKVMHLLEIEHFNFKHGLYLGSGPAVSGIKRAPTQVTPELHENVAYVHCFGQVNSSMTELNLAYIIKLRLQIAELPEICAH